MVDTSGRTQGRPAEATPRYGDPLPSTAAIDQCREFSSNCARLEFGKQLRVFSCVSRMTHCSVLKPSRYPFAFRVKKAGEIRFAESRF